MKLKKLVASILATTLVGTTMAFASMPMSASAETIPDTYTATLNGQFNETSFWNADGPSCTVSGDGQYSLTYTYTGEDGQVTADSMCLILLLDFNTHTCVEGGDVIASGITLDINSITLGGTNLNYTGSCVAPAYCHADNGDTIKLNIHNVWNQAQRAENVTVPSEIHNGDKLVVDFNINGLTNAIAKAKELSGESGGEETEATTVNTDNSEVTTEATTVDNSNNTPNSTTASTTIDNSKQVYITDTGKKYHYDNNCNGGDYYPSTLEEALSQGLEPCEKCVGDGPRPTTTDANSNNNSSNSNNSSSNNSSNTGNNSSNDSDDALTEDTATATGDARSTGIVLCFALVSACTGAIAMRKKH